MKKLILLLILIPMVSLGQTVKRAAETEIHYSFGLSVDPAMAVRGPYHGKSNDIGTTVNVEFRLGVEKPDWVWGTPLRAQIMLELHPAIKYTKATWLSLDYPISLLENVNLYVGPEISTIYRIDDTAHYSNPSNFRKHKNSRLRTGVNVDLTYDIPKTYLRLSYNFNYFQSEGGNDMKDYRWDTMVGLYLRF